jgi:hypothetical protein
VVFFVDYLELGKLIYLSFKTNKLCIIAIIAMLAVWPDAFVKKSHKM